MTNVARTTVDQIKSAGSSADLAILALLRDRPHPTEYLAEAVKTQGIRLYEGNVYAALERLLALGLVEREWQPGGNGLPARMYRITEAGVRKVGILDAMGA